MSDNLPEPTSGRSPFDALKRTDERGEHWSAREVAEPLGYTWRGFSDAIERGRIALGVNGQDPDIHIQRWKAPSNGVGRAETRTDYRMTREGVYATIQGADPRKPEIAAAWSYFRTKTREAEALVGPAFDPDLQRIYDLTVGMQQTRNDVKVIQRVQTQMAAELTAVAEDVADLKAVSPLIGGADMTIRDAARAVTGTQKGQNLFAGWLVQRGIVFRDHNEQLRCHQEWIRSSFADESWEQWSNRKGWSWVTRFTPRGIAKLKHLWKAEHA